MDGLMDIDAARALVSDAALWPRVRDFLWNFAPQIHASWLPSLQSLPSLPSSPRISRWLLAQLNVEPCFHPFPSTDASRLLLLDSDTLVPIAHWLGTLASASALRRVTGGAEVRALKTALPGVYPAVFSYAPYFAKTGILDTSQETSPDAIQTHGFSLLLSVLSDLPPPLLRRLALKLPATISGQSFSPSTDISNDSTVKRSNGQTVKLLLKLRFPEAFSLCFS